MRDSAQGRSVTRPPILLFLLLLAACSDAKPKQAVNEMIESPLQNTVIFVVRDLSSKTNTSR
jgi:hypothetical protein